MKAVNTCLPRVNNGLKNWLFRKAGRRRGGNNGLSCFLSFRVGAALRSCVILNGSSLSLLLRVYCCIILSFSCVILKRSLLSLFLRVLLISGYPFVMRGSLGNLSEVCVLGKIQLVGNWPFSGLHGHCAKTLQVLMNLQAAFLPF